MAGRTKAERELDTKRRAAALYVNGPEKTRGDWAATLKVLGVELSAADEDVRRLIEAEGGIPPEAPAQPPPLQFTPMPPPNPRDFVAAVAAKPDDEWCKLAEELRATVKGIADGSVKATAAQASTIRHVLERCYGKVQEKASEKKPASGVVILPALGSGSGLTICPRCGFDAGAGGTSTSA